MVPIDGCGAIIIAPYAKYLFLEGALTLPQDARRENILLRRLPDQSDDVDRFVVLYRCWSEVAQRLPDAQPSSSSGNVCDAVLGTRQPGLGQGWSLDGALMASGPRRSRPHMTGQEWYDMYRTGCPPVSDALLIARTLDGQHFAISNKIKLGKCVICEKQK